MLMLYCPHLECGQPVFADEARPLSRTEYEWDCPHCERQCYWEYRPEED